MISTDTEAIWNDMSPITTNAKDPCNNGDHVHTLITANEIV